MLLNTFQGAFTDKPGSGSISLPTPGLSTSRPGYPESRQLGISTSSVYRYGNVTPGTSVYKVYVRYEMLEITGFYKNINYPNQYPELCLNSS